MLKAMAETSVIECDICHPRWSAHRVQEASRIGQRNLDILRGQRKLSQSDLMFVNSR